MGFFSFLAKHPKTVCERCGEPFRSLGAEPKSPYFCAKCRTFELAQAEIDLAGGHHLDKVPRLPTMRGNIRVLKDWSPCPEQSDGSHLCPGCHSTLWVLHFAAMRPFEGIVEGEQLIAPYGPGTEMTLQECPHPDCHEGWAGVRTGSRTTTSGYTTEMTPPWARLDQEGHEKAWADWNQRIGHSEAGKGLTLKGMFGAGPAGRGAGEPPVVLVSDGGGGKGARKD